VKKSKLANHRENLVAIFKAENLNQEKLTNAENTEFGYDFISIALGLT
jgi:hypothetical protein